MKNVLAEKGQSLQNAYIQKREDMFFQYLESIKTILEGRLSNAIECKLVKRDIFYHIQIKPVAPTYTESSLFADLRLSDSIENFLNQVKNDSIDFIIEESFSYVAIDKGLIRMKALSIKDKDSYSLMFNLGL